MVRFFIIIFLFYLFYPYIVFQILRNAFSNALTWVSLILTHIPYVFLLLLTRNNII